MKEKWQNDHLFDEKLLLFNILIVFKEQKVGG